MKKKLLNCKDAVLNLLDNLLGMFGAPSLNREWCLADDTHVHKCAACGTTWQHPRGGTDHPETMTREEHVAAHTCPKCSKTEYYKADVFELKTIDYPWPGAITLEENAKTLPTKEELRLNAGTDLGWLFEADLTPGAPTPTSPEPPSAAKRSKQP